MKKPPKIIQNLSSEQFMELKRVINDPFFFSEFIYVINSMFGRTQFKLYPYQKAVLWEFLTKRFNIILKFRQAGLTELIAMYALWLAMYHPEKNILIISIKERVAKRLLKKIKYMYRNLPEHLKTPVINGRGEDIGTACVTLDTVLIGNKKNFKIGEIIPALPGILDVQHLDLQVLTHKGTFERVTKTINKGILQTWEIINDKGKILKCTPKHRLYTTKGWKTVKEVLEKNLNCIFKDYDFLQEVSSPITEKPKKEIIKETKLKGYYVSNWGRVFNKDLKRLKTRISGHERIKLKGSGGDKFYSVHRLVWETFNGPIPENFIVDHVDCVRTHNWLSNLQCITYSENTKRAYKFSRSLICNNYVHDKISLRKLGKIKELTLKYGNSYGSGRIIGDKLRLSTKRISLYRNSKTCNNTYISKIKLVNITKEVICDLEVENNHSYITESHYINHNTELEFSNGSLITSVPTTEDAGRSEALSLLIIDEAAIVKWANTIWAAAFPTLSTGGSAILNSCVTGDTEIIGRKGNFRIDSIAPKAFGKKDISNLGIEVLSHKGKWQKVIGAVNKGLLETWEIQDELGNNIKCTPNHRFYTPDGWKTAKEIIEKGQFVITHDLGLGKMETPPITIPPEKEVIREIPNYPNYRISNLGKLYYYKNNQLSQKFVKPNKWGYFSVNIWSKGSKKKITLSRLVAEVFIGEIPEGYIVDHINCNTLDNYVTNLQIITIAENTKRASKYSRSMILGNKIGSGFANLRLIGRIRRKARLGWKPSIIADYYKVTRGYVTRVLQNSRVAGVQISKLKVIRKYIDTIYDICVENDESYITNSNFINHNTPYGVGNFFHKTWVDSCAKGNNFNPIRLRWQMHPDRDIHWYNEQRLILGPRRTAQEIDGDFLTSGNNVFDLLDIRAIEDMLDEYTLYDTKNDARFNKLTTFNGQLQIFGPPIKGETYFIGSDIATGRARDYSSLTLMDKHGEEHAVFKGKIPINAHTKLLGDLGKIYNWAHLAPEANDIGLGVAMKLSEQGYRNLYYSKKLLREKGMTKPKEEKIPGWYTTKRNRPVIIGGLEEDIRLNNIIIKDRAFVNEAYTFIYDNENKPVAMGKGGSNSEEEMDGEEYTDDAILGKSITNHIRKGKVNSINVMPK